MNKDYEYERTEKTPNQSNYNFNYQILPQVYKVMTGIPNNIILSINKII